MWREKKKQKTPSYCRFISPAVFDLWENTCQRNFVWEIWEKVEGSSGFVARFNMSARTLFKILFAKLLFF